MSVDQIAKWAFIFGLVVLDVALLNFCDFRFRWSDLTAPAVCGTVLACLAWYHHRKQNPSLVLCSVSLLQLGCYSVVYSPMMYMASALNYPLIDGWLQAIDQLVGFSPVAVVGWTRQHPWIDFWSTWAYLFIVPETLIAVIFVALVNEKDRLQQFITQFMLGTFICGLFTWFFPAYGPLAHVSIAPANWQTPFVEHFHQLRSGQPFVFSWQDTEGLVTFPSFHTAWAIFLILLWSGQTRWLSIPMSLVSVLIVVSTLTTGSHYIVDIVGGVALAGVCIAASRQWSRYANRAQWRALNAGATGIIGKAVTE